MASEIHEELNQSANTELSVTCARCRGKTRHNVVVSVDQTGYFNAQEINWSASYQVIRCKGCNTLSFRNASSNSDDYVQVGPDDWEPQIFEALFPPRLEGRVDLGSDVIYLPRDLRRIYDETIQALNNKSSVLAGIGLRALVETVCKEKEAKGKDLSQKINDLLDKRVLTPAGANVLHKVRTLGNRAAHEVRPHSREQLALAMTVVEHMLKDVYILPKLVENKFE